MNKPSVPKCKHTNLLYTRCLACEIELLRTALRRIVEEAVPDDWPDDKDFRIVKTSAIEAGAKVLERVRDETGAKP